ncbi:MAG: hypothetical protein ACLFN4_03125 [Candidatus Acetothermia bacterium]
MYKVKDIFYLPFRYLAVVNVVKVYLAVNIIRFGRYPADTTVKPFAHYRQSFLQE